MTDEKIPTGELQRLITESRLASRWGKSRRTIQRWRASGRMPQHIRIGSTVFYCIDEVIKHENGLKSEAENV